MSSLKSKKEMLMEMKIIDTTIEGVKETEMYKNAQSFNAGIRAYLSILQKHCSVDM
jgi:hypothetical protein